ncbi:putative quinol monooxygenase [Streptomyces sp. NPDC093676]|uniref:putative quinol monooxygenase n=1 Tax=Streptomyces sp. NPDC093676 TaxID=3366050 RepID=UPI003810B2A4
MIIRNVFFDVTQEHEAKFLKLLNHMVVESNKEDGCSPYQLWRNAHDPYSYVLVEHWETQGHLDAHGKTPQWIDFNDTVNGYLKSDYDEHHYNEIPR